MWSFFEFLDDDCIVTVLDIGAALLESPPYQSLVDAKRARLIGFEPDVGECAKLNKKYGEPHSFYPYFVGDGKPAIFHKTNWGATGSLFEPNTPLLDKFHCLGELVIPVAQHPVVTKRLDDIDEIVDVDFLKIDVQGSELSIFQNADRVLADAVLIQTEVSFVEIYKQQPMFSDVDKFLRSNGYQLHDFGAESRSFKPLLNSRSPNPHPLLRAFRQKLWGDAFYVKDWMHLDRLPPSKLKKLAALLHDIVGSYDLAYVALQAMDMQLGTEISARYLQRLEGDGICVADTAHTASLVAELKGKINPSAPIIPLNPGADKRPSIVLTTEEGISISVPASLNCITTYVILEQERWFEKETHFILHWLQQGMNAIDIGANVGVFSLPMARRVGLAGRVFAFEPGSENRQHLERSRIGNGLDNLHISACALSDSAKEGWLQIESSGELNSLIEDSESSENAERVQVSTVDIQEQECSWPSIDFVKIDAEGQEARIVAGGRDFFRRQSPLVMYEVKSGLSYNTGLRWIFEALGYATYRLLGDASCLVPVSSDEALDSFELNLFAAKPDRAASMAVCGLLVTEPVVFCLADEERNKAIEGMLGLLYAQSFEFSKEDIFSCEYGEALIAYAAYRFVELSPARRYAALCAAFAVLSAHCANTPTSTGLASLARVALDLGCRLVAVEVLKELLDRTGERIEQPFFPPCRRYENLPSDGCEADWFYASVIEQLEISQAFSSRFANDSPARLQLLCESAFASAEMSRRTLLKLARTGMGRRDFSRYLNPNHQHRNPTYWTPSGLSELISLL